MCKKSLDYPLKLTSSNSIVDVHNLCVTVCVQAGKDSPRKAKEFLLKKLKYNKDEINDIVTIIITHGAHSIGCVAISRTLDGRI